MPKTNAISWTVSSTWTPVILVAATIAAYSNSFCIPLLFDDWVSIGHNTELGKSWPPWAMFLPPENTGLGGRPVANATFVLNHALTGMRPAGFHAVNLLIHACAALALFGALRRTLAGEALRERFGGQASLLAGLIASLWAVHPVLTQAVTYISQRTESLMGCFYFLSLYCFIRSLDAERRFWWQSGCVACCLAGIGSKESFVTAPVMLFFYEYFFRQKTIGVIVRERWRFFAAIGTSWVLLLILMRGLGGRGVGFGKGMAVGEYLSIQAEAVVRYVQLGIWPYPLVFDYGTDLGDFGAARAACAIVLAGVGLLIVRATWRRQLWGFPVLWFFVTLAPTSSLVPIPLQPISENRVYVPMAALVSIAVLGSARVLGRHTIPVLLAGVTACVVLTVARNHDYRSDVAIWADTVAKRPENSRAHNNLGNALREAGRLQESRTHLLAAIQRRPDYANAHANLAATLGQLGDLEGAIQSSREALRHDPNDASAWNNLGAALVQKGVRDEAIAAYRSHLALQPHSVEGNYNLALLLIQEGRGAEAIECSSRALARNPRFAPARFILAYSLALVGRFNDAAPQFEQFLSAQPDHYDARINYAVALYNLNRLEEAAAQFEAAAQLAPNAALPREYLARVRAARANARPK